MSVDAVLERLTLLHPKSIDLSLGRIKRVLAALGHPELRLPPIVHIAGTNGKGSVGALMRAMLSAAGYKVQAYTSPHLVNFRERVRLSTGIIAEDQLIGHLEACERASVDDLITFFEVTTAAAFLAFANDPADILLLEVGLGGRLDATNLFERPRLTVITPVSLDHQGFLGDDLTSIAGEKAGVLKKSVTCVVGPQPDEALAAIRNRAADVGAPLVEAGRDWFANEIDGRLVFQTGTSQSAYPVPALPGHHQIGNAGIALACLDQLARPDQVKSPGHPESFKISGAARADGLLNATWPARLQKLTGGALHAALADGSELWLDGGHNPAAAAELATTIQAWNTQNPRPLYLVTGMMRTKGVASFLAPFAVLKPKVFAVPVAVEKTTHPPQHIAAAASELGLENECHDNVKDAVASIAKSEAPVRILICGSLYLAGHVLREYGPPIF